MADVPARWLPELSPGRFVISPCSMARTSGEEWASGGAHGQLPAAPLLPWLLEIPSGPARA